LEIFFTGAFSGGYFFDKCWCMVIFPEHPYSDLAIGAGGVRVEVFDPGCDEHLVTSAPVEV